MARKWAPTDDGSADGIRVALDQVADVLVGVGMWASDHMSGGRLREDLKWGLIGQAGVAPDQATETARKMVDLMRQLAETAAAAAVSAEVLGDMIEGEYIEPVRNRRALGGKTAPDAILIN